MNRRLGLGAAVALGLSVFLAAPAAQAEETGTTPAPATDTIAVPDDFVPVLSGTGDTGHFEVVDGGLHIWTEGTTGTDKVAEYVATTTPLAGVREPVLDYEATEGGAPGFQLVVDFAGDGTAFGTLVGEPTAYGDDWWLTNGSASTVKDDAPSHTGGSGSENHGTLTDWRTAFPDAVVKAFGFSLGSGVYGDGVLHAIDFAGTHYTFAVVLDSKDECKNGGWATSTLPVYKNQGQCVSHFATSSHNGNADTAAPSSVTSPSAGGTSSAVAATRPGAARSTGTVKKI